ncbi:hypothetical protein HN587_05840 [Candidatus Woesearchaeota archaeon]|nr:hypothetical protein [Candidatus Woesearchaeota archaeon]
MNVKMNIPIPTKKNESNRLNDLKKYAPMILLAVIIIGSGLFFVLQDNTGGSQLTSAVVTDSKSLLTDGETITFEDTGANNLTDTTIDSINNSDARPNDASAAEKNAKIIDEEYVKRIDTEIMFDQIPSLNKESKIKSIVLEFTDLTTKINVNDDQLELNDLNKAKLEITNFDGSIKLDEIGFSLNGVAERIEVNNIALATKEKIKLSFTNLNYDTVFVKEINFKNIELSKGNGVIEIPEKMTYYLKGDILLIEDFFGDLTIDKEEDQKFNLEGGVTDIDVNGNTMNLNLR